MGEKTVTVETEVPIEEAFLDETTVYSRENREESTHIDHVGNGVLAVSPSEEGAEWVRAEFDAIHDSPWRIVNVECGAYGPEIHVVREE